MPTVPLVIAIAALESLLFAGVAGLSAWAGSGFTYPLTSTVVAAGFGTFILGFFAHLGKRMPTISKYANMPWTLRNSE